MDAAALARLLDAEVIPVPIVPPQMHFVILADLNQTRATLSADVVTMVRLPPPR